MERELRVATVTAASRFFVNRWFICLALSLLVFAVYAPVLEHGFVNLDDDEYVTDNYQVRQGLRAEGAGWALVTFSQGNWHPLTWLSHMLDVQLFGMSPRGHHLTSLLFHLGNTNLLFLVLASLTGTIWSSALVAALFGVHPLHVESVAWVAERKDVLSTFFGLLALRVYVGYVRIPVLRLYCVTLLLFLLAISAKAMLVMLPFIFMLLDWWPLGRYRFAGGDKRVAGLVLEKVPFLFAAGGCAVLTVIAQQQGGALAGLSVDEFSGTVANALVSYVRYLSMTLWPSKLAVFYPFQGVSGATAAASALMLCGVALFVLLARRGHPYLTMGLFWYLGTLLPVIGII